MLKKPIKDATAEISKISSSELEIEKRDKTRIENFVDAVFAIAITLLILDLQVPLLAHSNSIVLGYIGGLWPKFVAYILAFFVLAILLNNHHRQFRNVQRADSRVWWINITLLAFIVFVPFSTSLLSEYGDTTIGVMIFSINMLVAGLLLFFNWNYLTHTPHLLREDINQRTIKYLKYINLVVPIAAGIAILCAFINPRLSIISYVLVLLIRIIVNRIYY